MRVVFRRLAGALCYQCAVLSVRFDDTARLGFRSRLYLLGGGAGKVFGGRCFCPGARGQLPDCRNLAGHFPGTGWLDVWPHGQLPDRIYQCHIVEQAGGALHMVSACAVAAW